MFWLFLFSSGLIANQSPAMTLEVTLAQAISLGFYTRVRLCNPLFLVSWDSRVPSAVLCYPDAVYRKWSQTLPAQWVRQGTGPRQSSAMETACEFGVTVEDACFKPHSTKKIFYNDTGVYNSLLCPRSVSQRHTFNFALMFLPRRLLPLRVSAFKNLFSHHLPYYLI